MLLSVVTPSYNQASFLADLIENVRSQGRPGQVEHIVVDGGSTDGTVDLLRSYDGIIRWVSEADHGQSHAVNKGMSMAQGDILAWINCDDRYAPGAIDLVRAVFERRPDLEFVYGDALGVDAQGRTYGLRAHVRPCTIDDLVNEGDPIVQPAAFWRPSVRQRFGDLNEGLAYAFDYEYWMRVASVVPLTYLPVCLAVESMHGRAKTSRGDDPRMREIEQTAVRFGGRGVPRGFRAEAAALETRAMVRDLAAGDVQAARLRGKRVRDLHAPAIRYAMHAVAQAVPGTGAVPRLRLMANRLRSHRPPVYPGQISVDAALDLLTVADDPTAGSRAAEAVLPWEP